MHFPTHIVAVGGLVTNDEGKVLLVRNPRRGWEFPGGQVEVGESLPQALIREIHEESGVLVKVTGIVGIYSNTSVRKGYNGVREIPTIVNIDFRCRYISGALHTGPESLETAWFSVEQARREITYPKYIYRFENMVRDDGVFHCDAFRTAEHLPEGFEFFEKYLFH